MANKNGISLAKEILSFKEAVAYMNVSQSLLYKLTSQGKITHFKPNNGKIYFKRIDLDQWMLQNEVKSINAQQEQVSNYLSRRSNG